MKAEKCSCNMKKDMKGSCGAGKCGSQNEKRDEKVHVAQENVALNLQLK